MSNGTGAPLVVQDGKLRLSMAQLVAAVVENNLTIASARYYPLISQTDVFAREIRDRHRAAWTRRVFRAACSRARLAEASWARRAVAAGGSSNPGGITGSAGRVSVSPSGVFDPTLRMSFSYDHTSSPLNTLVVAGVPSVTNTTAAYSWSWGQAFSSGTSFTVSYSMQRQASTQKHLLLQPGLYARIHSDRQPAIAQRVRFRCEPRPHQGGGETNRRSSANLSTSR
ncbi:MAG: hypothetical protein WDO73_01335 [Ignavibacteriota bacterium]